MTESSNELIRQQGVPKRPALFNPFEVGKRVISVHYGIKQTSDYIRDAEAYMNYCEAQVQDALRINSALRESMKEAMDELYPATGYRALNAFDMLNAALTQSAEVPYSNR